MKKLVKLPNRLVIALARYYINRFRSRKQVSAVTLHSDGSRTEEMQDGVPWDKNADLENITAALPKNWGYQACAGSFWLFGMSKTHHYYVDESTWPNAEIHSNK